MCWTLTFLPPLLLFFFESLDALGSSERAQSTEKKEDRHVRTNIFPRRCGCAATNEITTLETVLYLHLFMTIETDPPSLAKVRDRREIF